MQTSDRLETPHGCRSLWSRHPCFTFLDHACCSTCRQKRRHSSLIQLQSRQTIMSMHEICLITADTIRPLAATTACPNTASAGCSLIPSPAARRLMRALKASRGGRQEMANGPEASQSQCLRHFQVAPLQKAGQGNSLKRPDVISLSARSSSFALSKLVDSASNALSFACSTQEDSPPS